MAIDTERPTATGVAGDTAYWRSRLAALIAEHGVPGAALGILRDCQIVDVAAGVLNRRTQVPATPDSVFNLGSITKVWTATLIMQLVDEGALDLDTAVARVLPEFAVADAAATAAITVRHLLSHTSGIDDMYAETGRGDDCVERYVANLRDLPQVRPVGATFSYCNAGIVVAGRIVEVLTGKTWDAALRERVVGPLGLTATVTLPEEAILHRVAVGHPGGPDAPPTRVWSGPRGLAPTGRISARVHDLLAFVRMHLAGGTAPGPGGTRLLSADSAQAMIAKAAELPCPSIMGDSWGLGWARDTWAGQPVIGHSGTGIGQLAFVRALPGRGFAVALLTNGGDGLALYHDVFAETFRELAGVTMPAPFRPPAEPAAIDVTPYVGRYYARSDTAVELVRRDGALALRLLVTGLLRDRFPATAGEFALVPVAAGRFAMRTEDSRTWEIVQAHQPPGGPPCLYSNWGLVASPLVGAPAG